MQRETLEYMALSAVSSENYYDLADTIDYETDDTLYKIIACDGDYIRESELVTEGVTK